MNEKYALEMAEVKQITYAFHKQCEEQSSVFPPSFLCYYNVQKARTRSTEFLSIKLIPGHKLFLGLPPQYICHVVKDLSSLPYRLNEAAVVLFDNSTDKIVGCIHVSHDSGFVYHFTHIEYQNSEIAGSKPIYRINTRSSHELADFLYTDAHKRLEHINNAVLTEGYLPIYSDFAEFLHYILKELLRYKSRSEVGSSIQVFALQDDSGAGVKAMNIFLNLCYQGKKNIAVIARVPQVELHSLCGAAVIFKYEGLPFAGIFSMPNSEKVTLKWCNLSTFD